MTVEEGKRIVLEKIEEVTNLKVRKHLLDMALMQYQLIFEELKDVNKQCREAIAREMAERKAKIQRQAAQRASQAQTEAQTHALIEALAEFQAEVEAVIALMEGGPPVVNIEEEEEEARDGHNSAMVEMMGRVYKQHQGNKN